MLVIKNKQSNWVPCPEYNGVAKIVDATEIRDYEGKFGTKPAFRYILEIETKKTEKTHWTVSTRPFTLSLHEKAGLRQFVDRAIGPLTAEQVEAGIDTESLIGKYVHIIVEHSKGDEDVVYANITYVSKPKNYTPWESEYVRFTDRDTLTKEATAEEIAASTADDRQVVNEVPSSGLDASDPKVKGIIKEYEKLLLAKKK